MKTLALFFALFTVACGQYYPILPTNASQLTIGVPYAGFVAPQFSEDFGYIDSYTYVYIPENVYHFNITLSTISLTGCDEVEMYLRMDGYPCYESAPFSSSYLCNDEGYIGNAEMGYPTTATFYPGSFEYDAGVNYQFISGGFIYIAVQRYNSYYYNDTCAYTLLVQADSCPGNVNNSIASSSSYAEASDTFCTTYTNVVNANGTGAFTSFFSGNDTVFKYIAPTNLGYLNVYINSSADFYAYGTSYESYENSYGAVCYTEDAQSIGNYYVASFNCSAVPAGNFYITLTNAVSGTMISGSITITPTICSTGVGMNCNSPMINFTSLLAPIVVPSLLEDQFAYGNFLISSTLLPIGATVGFTITSTNDSQLYISRNRYVTYNQDNAHTISSVVPGSAEPNYVYLSGNDANLFNGQLPGTYWASVVCNGDICTDIKISANYTGSNVVGLTTGGMMKMTTGGMMNMNMTTGMMKMNMTTGGMMKMTTGAGMSTTASLTTHSLPATTVAAASSDATVVIASILFTIIAAIFV